MSEQPPPWAERQQAGLAQRGVAVAYHLGGVQPSRSRQSACRAQHEK